MSTLLWRSVLRYLPHHPWQLVLAILGIALGVAVVLGTDLANASARKSFELSMERVTGRATHRIVGEPDGVPEEFYTQLRVDLGLRLTAPIVVGHAATAEMPGRRLQVLGVDLFAEATFRDHLDQAAAQGADLSDLLTRPNSALFSRDLADSGSLDMLVGDRQVTLQNAGRLNDAALEGLIVVDIGTAQVLLDRIGRLDHIDLILPEGEAGERQAAEIAKRLPHGARIERPAERNRAVQELSTAFQLNLTVLSLLALIVGMFLIYNTMAFAVVQRRPLLGMLRALGATRREILALVLGEALILGLAGTLLGGVLGVWLGSGLVQLVTRTIDDLYYTLAVREFHVVPLSLVKAGVLGLLATIAAAWLPAREAANAPPGSALSRAVLETRWRRSLPRLSIAGLILLALGASLIALSSSLAAGFAGLFLILLACTLVTPTCLTLSVRCTQHLLNVVGSPNTVQALWRERLLAIMAIRNVNRSLSRTGVAVASLMVAFAAAVGVGIMVESFRGGVVIWLEDLLNADLYVVPYSAEGSENSTPLQPEVLADLRRTNGVDSVSTYRRHRIELGGKPTSLIVVDLASKAREGYRFKLGDPTAAWQAFAHEGAVLVSEPLAYRHGITVGESVSLPTSNGPRAFPIAGVFYDYGSEHGRVLIDRATYDRHWIDRSIRSAAIYAAPGMDVDHLRAHLESTVGHLQALRIRGNGEILQRSLAVFDRTFTVTGVLRLLAIGVAFVGMISALMALQLERAREFGVLRATGMTTGEIGAIVSIETGFMGLAAGLLALPVGLGMAAFLIYVIQRRAFGWTVPFEIDPWILLQSVLLAVLAALLAAIYPLLKMAATSPANALRSE